MAGLFETAQEIGPFSTDNSKRTGGSQRDLANAIFSVDAKSTPLLSMIPKAEGVVNTTYEYPVDAALDPKDNATTDSFASAELNENTDFDNALEKYSIIQNNVQWFRRASLIGKLAESASNLAGAPDLRATSIRKQLEAIKRDMEVRFCSDTIPKSGGGTYYSGEASTAPLKTRSLGAYLTDDNSNIPTNFQVAENSVVKASEVPAVSSLTEANVQDVLQSIYEQTGVAKELTLLCGANLKKQFRNFTQTATEGTDNKAATRIRTFNQDMESRSIVSSIDFFDGDFGQIALVPTLWNAKHDWGSAGSGSADGWTAATGKAYGYVLDMDFLELRFHELPSVTPLPNLGAGERYEISAIAGLSVLNPLAFGAFKHTS